jgi:hyperosmotically inducible periplasmic protein
MHRLMAMHGFITACAVAAVVVFALTGCQSMTGETAGENIDDTTITTAVKAKLAGDKATTLTKVGVETNLRTVHLTGVVTSEELRQRAGELARSVKGVREVKNDIQVRPSS